MISSILYVPLTLYQIIRDYFRPLNSLARQPLSIKSSAGGDEVNPRTTSSLASSSPRLNEQALSTKRKTSTQLDGASTRPPDAEGPREDEKLYSPVNAFLDRDKIQSSGDDATTGADRSTDWMGEEPVPTSFLTSRKGSEAPLIKYLSRLNDQKAGKSDKEWVTYMQTCALQGEKGKLLKKLPQAYKESSDAFRLCCDFLEMFAVTQATGRAVFQRAALSELGSWRGRHSSIVPALNNQITALDNSFLCNSSQFSKIADVFELRTVPKSDLVAFIKDKLRRKKKYLNHMCFVIAELELQDHFETSDLILPLLSMDKMMTVEAYISPSKTRVEFIRLLDGLLEPTGSALTTLLETLKEELEYNPTEAQFKFTRDQIMGLMKRLMKKYDIPLSTAPHLSQIKIISSLKDILYTKYRKGGSGVNWTGMIVETVQGSDILQRALLNEILVYGDEEYAADMVNVLKCPESVVPGPLHEYMTSRDLWGGVSGPTDQPTSPHDIPEVVDIDWDEMFDDGDDLLDPSAPLDPDVFNDRLILPSSVNTHDVNSLSSLQHCQQVLSQASVIGLDSEWRMSLDPTKPVVLSLVQLACSDTVFLMDVPAVLSVASEQDLESFVTSVFRTQTVVGYSLDQDVKHLTRSIPVFGTHLKSYDNVIDLAVAHRHLTKREREARAKVIQLAMTRGDALPAREATSELTGLARLSNSMFPGSGTLDKTHQLSDWNVRPLTVQQRSYAALDAYILLPLYHKLSVLFPDIKTLAPMADVEAAAATLRAMSFTPASAAVIPSHALRVLADVPLQGLGKKLRHIGIDTAILDNHETVDDAARISMAEDRIVLSKDSNSQRLMKLLDPGRVYRVKAHLVAEQLAEIRSHFNLVIADEDFFARCAICNCSTFVKVPRNLAKAMFECQQEPHGTPSPLLPWHEVELCERRVSHAGTSRVSSDGVTEDGHVRLQLDKVKRERYEEIGVFWGCGQCGKIYWDGCHMRKFRDKHGI